MTASRQALNFDRQPTGRASPAAALKAMSRRLSLADRRALRANNAALAAPAVPSPHVASCCLASALLELWAWGVTSAKSVQRLAQAGVDDGCPSRALELLGKTGCSGRHPNNCQRDLLRLLSRHLPPQPIAIQISIPFTNGKEEGAGTRLLTQPYLPLHRVFAHLYAKYPAQFAKVWGTPAGATAFWENVRDDDPNFAQWRARLAHKQLDALIPFALHGDGVPVFRHKSLECWSANSLLAEGSAKDVKSLMFCYWSHLRAVQSRDGADTEAGVWKAIAWDVEALFEGLHPCLDSQQRPWLAGTAEAALSGTQLAAGLCGVPWVLKGDLEHFANVLRLASTAARQPCLYCQADRDGMPWTDFSSQAAWKDRAWQNAEWRDARPRHPAFDVLCLGIHSAHADVLHTLALGVAQQVVGSTLWLLVYRTMPGSAKHNLQSVWDHIHEYYRRCSPSTRIRKLTLSMFLPSPKSHKKNYPCMTTKGKETEGLVGAVLWIWHQYCSEDDAHDASVSCVLACLDRIFFLSRKVGSALHLAQGEAAEIRSSLDSLLLHYTALGNRAAAQGDMLWNVTPKFHIAWHWAWQTQFLHPHASACYVDESFVGVIAKICKSSTNGVKLDRAASAVFAKYSRAMSVHLALTPGSPFSPWL